MTEGSLATTFTITNTGEAVLPASMGAHPAFRWPLVPGTPKEAYALTFDADETAPIGVLAGGLLSDEQRPSPVHGRRLPLTPGLFERDALIFLEPASRSVTFAAGRGLCYRDVGGVCPAWPLGPADGDFLCIEPWLGVASPAGFAGDFAQKPYVALVPPGASRIATFRITV